MSANFVTVFLDFDTKNWRKGVKSLLYH